MPLVGMPRWRRACRTTPMDWINFGSEGQRHGHGDTGLVQHRRERAEEPVRARQRVGRAETEQDHGDLQSLHEGVEDRLHGDGPADAHGDRPGGERHLREREDDVSGYTALSEQDLDHHPDHNDQHADTEEERYGACPGCTAPACGHHHTGHDADQCQQERVVRPHGADRQAGRPEPPGDRVQGAAPGGGGPRHSSAGLRRHRKRARPPSAATTTAIRITGRALPEAPPPEWREAALATRDRWVLDDP